MVLKCCQVLPLGPGQEEGELKEKQKKKKFGYRGFHNFTKLFCRVNALTAAGTLRILIDFTLSNARLFYSSVGNPLAVKGL